MRSLLPLLLALCAADGCSRRSLLVCEAIGEDGSCRVPRSEIEAGRRYWVLAKGTTLPVGDLEFRVSGLSEHGRRVEARRSERKEQGEAPLRAPLTIVHPGDYEVSIHAIDGIELESARVTVVSRRTVAGVSTQ